MDYYGLSESDVLPEGLGQVFTMPEKDRRKVTVPMATNPPSGDGHRNGAVRNLNVIFSFCREINGEKKNFCLVTNPRKKLKYRMFTGAES